MKYKKLIVPKEILLRKLMRETAKDVAQSDFLFPPVKFEQLNKLAKKIIEILNISDNYLSFALVLAGNEVWRKIIQAVPFKRRLLLLPQCIRNKNKCKGEFDQLGLICAACNACDLDSILNKAEELGYFTLIAEGTSTALELVEEGSVDAVIGVSCMPVLERSFRKVSGIAIPVMGIPLLFDGCDNTELDYHWLMEELDVYKPNDNLKPISIPLVNDDIKEFFTQSNMADLFNGERHTDKIALDYLLSGGGRMRPLLSALSYNAYSKTPYNKTVLTLSLLIECFHKASLIHDDLEDHSEIRYNKPTLHTKYGNATAINIGDYLLGKGYEMLTKLNVAGAVLSRCLSTVSQSHIKLTQGQGDDILFSENKLKYGLEEIIEVFRLKTGEAIKVALLLGAIVANADDKEMEVLVKFSENMGIAYQIKDDMEEFGKQYENKKTADFPVFTAMLNQKNISGGIPEEINEFEKLVSQYEITELVENLLQNYISSSYDLLDQLGNKKMRLSLYSIMGKVFKNYTIEE